MDATLAELLLFDSSKPAPSFSEIIVYASVILISSQVIFFVITKLISIENVQESLDTEKVSTFEQWKKKGVTPWNVLFSDLINSCIYGPVSEELMFRALLMKMICIKQLKMSPLSANIVQATIFGKIHLTNSVFTMQSEKYSKLQALSATISGLISGFVFIQSNSLLPSLIAHIINNVSASIYEVYGYYQYNRRAA